MSNSCRKRIVDRRGQYFRDFTPNRQGYELKFTRFTAALKHAIRNPETETESRKRKRKRNTESVKEGSKRSI